MNDFLSRQEFYLCTNFHHQKATKNLRPVSPKEQFIVLSAYVRNINIQVVEPCLPSAEECYISYYNSKIVNWCNRVN